MKIKNLVIDGTSEPKLIAELGTLHLSSYSNLLQACEDMEKANADAIKVQLINWRTAWWANQEQSERYQKLELNVRSWKLDCHYEPFQEFILNWKQALIDLNKRFKIPVFASAFDAEFVTILNDVVPAWKLGYKALSMPALQEAVYKSSKPIFQSFDLLASDKILTEPDFIPMLTQPDYPIRPSHLRLVDFRRSFFRGLSIHAKYPGIIDYVKASCKLGCKVFEIHAMGEGAEGPDTLFACNTEQMNELKTVMNQERSTTRN